MTEKKELSLLKGEERFIFRYTPGEEESVLDAFVHMANDRANPFDWFDAAVLSFQLSKHLVEQADHLLCPEHGESRQEATNPQTPWPYSS